MSTTNAMPLPETYPLCCPNWIQGERCAEALYVRHTEAGTLDSVAGRHYITNVTWQAQCRKCQWESPKRSTVWALIKTVRDALAGTPAQD